MLRKPFFACAGSCLLVIGMSACSNSKASSQDQSITQAVQSKLNADPALQGSQIDASTENGVVTLTGNVNSEAARVDAARDAQVPGATQVNNQIATNTAMTAPAMTGEAMTGNAPASRKRNESRASNSASEPAPEMHAAAPVEIEAGTPLHVRLSKSLGSDTATEGETFSGTLSEPVLVNGQIAIPKGADVTGAVAAVDSAGHFKGQSRLVLKLTRLSFNGQSFDLTTHTVSRVASSRTTRSAETIGGGAALGTIIGAIAGHGKGAAIGAAAGAGAGTAAQALTKPAEVELPAETVLTFTLSNPVQVVPAAAAE